MKFCVFLFSILSLSTCVYAQQSLIIDSNLELGGSSGDFVSDFIVDTDGSIYVIGETSSNDFDFINIPSGYNAFVMKISSTGTVQWVEAVGGGTGEYFYSIIKASDGYLYIGGKAIVNSGTMQSISGVVSENTGGGNTTIGGYDGLLMKISTDGIVNWLRTYGSFNPDHIVSVHEGNNGQLCVIGNTTSFGNNDVPVSGNGHSKIWNFYVSKTNGSMQSTNVVHTGGSLGVMESLYASDSKITPTGVVITGFANSSNSTSGCAPTSTSSKNVLLMKLSNTGSILWDKYYGSNGAQCGRALNINQDNSIVVAGYSANASNTCDVQSTSIGLDDVYVIKTDASGNFLWGKLYGGSSDDDASGIIELTSGNYLISAFSLSNDTGVTHNGLSDVYIFELDANGNFLSNHDMFGGTANDVQGVSGSSILTSDCYLYLDSSDNVWFSSAAQSNNGDLPGTLSNTTSNDIWIVGLGGGGNTTSCDWVGYVYNPFTNYREAGELPCIFVNGGTAHIPSSETGQSTYWTGFVNPNNLSVSGDNVSLEVRLRNNSSEGGIFCFDSELWLLGEDNFAAVGLMTTTSSCEQYAFIGTDDNMQTGQTHNLSNLQLNLSSYKDIMLQVSGNQVRVYSNNTLLRTVTYGQLLGNLKGIKLAFKGSGKADWVKVTDLNNNIEIYNEQFNDCSTICPSCNTDQNINQYYIPTGAYEASNSIQSSAKVSGLSNVEYKAMQQIDLLPGFETEIGCLFESYIGPCTF